MPDAITHRFVFDSPDRARLFVRQVLAACEQVATMRHDATVWVIDGQQPPQTEKLASLAQSGPSSIPPPLPHERVSRAPTMVEVEVEDDE